MDWFFPLVKSTRREGTAGVSSLLGFHRAVGSGWFWPRVTLQDRGGGVPSPMQAPHWEDPRCYAEACLFFERAWKRGQGGARETVMDTCAGRARRGLRQWLELSSLPAARILSFLSLPLRGKACFFVRFLFVRTGVDELV